MIGFFAATGEATPVAVAETLGLSRSATYRILDTLRQQGLIEVNPISEKLRLGGGGPAVRFRRKRARPTPRRMALGA